MRETQLHSSQILLTDPTFAIIAQEVFHILPNTPKDFLRLIIVDYLEILDALFQILCHHLVGNGHERVALLLDAFLEKLFQARADLALHTGCHGTDGIGRVFKGLKRDPFEQLFSLFVTAKEGVMEIIGTSFGKLLFISDL
jgi:hypothetical protein